MCPHNPSPDFSIRTASQQDVPAAAEVLAGAFAQDPSAQVFVAGRSPSSAAQALRPLLEGVITHHYLRRGSVDVASTPAGKILGVALWQAPRQRMSLPTLARLGVVLVRHMGIGAVWRYLRNEARNAGLHPKFAHWYLFMIGVAEGTQGLGVGGALLRHGTERAGETACYLEASTPDSAALYARHGFVPMGATNLTANTANPEYGMWRPGAMPQRDASASTGTSASGD